MKETEQKISKEKIEWVKTYLAVFAKMYKLQTSKTLTSVDQIIKLISSGEFTFDDVFETFLCQCLDTNASKTEQIFWEDNMSLFYVENYFPNDNKNVGEGAWIKIRTENGFEVHYAKKANRKRRYNEEYEAAQKKYAKLLKVTIAELEDMTIPYSEKKTDEKESKIKKTERQMYEAGVRMALLLPVYEVKIMRTKTVAEYYLPTQYELVTDIDEFSDAYINQIPGVNIKSLYSAANKDAVFYLQSRGISKKVAEMMAALKQTYFKVNMEEAINAYNDFLRKHVQIVETN